MLFKFMALHGTNLPRGAPWWQGQSAGSPQERGRVRPLAQSEPSPALLAGGRQLAAGSSSSRAAVLQAVQGSQFATV